MHRFRRTIRKSIAEELEKPKPSIDVIMGLVISYANEYQTENLNFIQFLEREKKVTSKKISGALMQTIKAHGPITTSLIGSATKRIYGTILNSEVKPVKVDWFTKLKKFIKNI